VSYYFAGEAQKKYITLVLDYNELPKARIDSERVTQVLNNLLDNALKNTSTNGRITLRAKQQDGQILIEVEDTGCGIPPSKLVKIFQPYQIMNKQNNTSDGMGLGLALSKMLIELHNGKIWAQSSEGKGSTFSFTLPLKRKDNNYDNPNS